MGPALLLVTTLLSLEPLVDGYAVDQAPPEGLWLHAALGAGVIGGDVAVGAEAGVGFETHPFAVHLTVPLTLRVVDLPPTVDPAAPRACRFVRCEEWLDAGALSIQSLGRAVDEVRVLHAGDVFHLRGGRVFATLGHGQLVDEYTNAPDWDRRHTGLYLQSDLPWGRTEGQALVGDFLAPQELFAARVSLSPMVSDAEDLGAGDRFLGRLRVGFEAAGDLAAPTFADRFGDVVPNTPTGTVGGLAVDASWPLLDDAGHTALQFAPWLGASTEVGLRDGGGVPGVGAGAAVGVDASVDAIVVAARVGAHAFVDSPAHRSGLFNTLYDVDRRRFLEANGAFSSSGIAVLPCPGGVGGAADVELVVLRIVRAGARLHLDPVPEASRGEVYAGVDAGSVRVDVRAQQRAFADARGALTWGDRTFLVADAAWQVFAPFSLVARWLHGPRFHPVGSSTYQRGDPAADDDVFVGASFDLVLSPG